MDPCSFAKFFMSGHGKRIFNCLVLRNLIWPLFWRWERILVQHNAISYMLKITSFGMECYSGFIAKYYSLIFLHYTPRFTVLKLLSLSCVSFSSVWELLVRFSIIFISNNFFIIPIDVVLKYFSSACVIYCRGSPNYSICIKLLF